MNDHDHGFTPGEWPFPDPENVAAICCRHVSDGEDILRVTHDEDDGCWQILCGGTHEEEDARVVCLACMVKRDESLRELADLPRGWYAERADKDSPWERFAATLEAGRHPALDEDGFALDLIEGDEKEDYGFELPGFPTDAERFSVTAGDFVKLIFRYRDRVEKGGQTITCERMWVEVEWVEGTVVVGRLDSDPRYTRLIEAGDSICFHPKHIVQFHKSDG